MFKRIIVLSCISLLSLSASPLLKTGQTRNYDHVKDDSYYQKGAARSYSRSGNIVTEEVTGLSWQDNTLVTDLNWTKAINYCDVLILNSYKDWRLPNILELETLTDYGEHEPALTKDELGQEVFQYIAPADNSYYCSSTTYIDDIARMWIIDSQKGYTTARGKIQHNSYVRCVRGKQLEPSGLSRNAETMIVSDNTTGLEWQDDVDANITRKDWIDAIDYCEESELGNHKDWRLPNINELLSITNRLQYNPAMNDIFKNYATGKNDYYWTSTYYDHGIGYAWSVWAKGGSSYMFRSKGNYSTHVRCVRGGPSEAQPALIMYLLD